MSDNPIDAITPKWLAKILAMALISWFLIIILVAA